MSSSGVQDDQAGPAPLRAGILVTGTEVLTATIRDENGPWLSGKLDELGFEVAEILVVGDRPEDLRAGLDHMAGLGFDLIVTTGGLGPTADDLTAQIVADFSGREMLLDEAMEGKIRRILERFAANSPETDREALMAANRKQAMVPRGAIPLDPVGTAPGLVVPGRDDGPLVLVLPGPPRELRPMWDAALELPEMKALFIDLEPVSTRHLRMFGTPESELASALREFEADGLELAAVEVTTCLRKGEVEVDIRHRAETAVVADRLVAALSERFSRTLYSRDGAKIDQLVAELLAGRRLALAESCTAGLLAARIADRPGSSDYLLGGVVAYSNQVKREVLGVDAGLLERHGAVSAEVAEAMARGALERFEADVAVGITGVAGPGGGSEEKPVGLVYLHAVTGDGRTKAVAPVIPGSRAEVRERAALVGMHLLRWLLA